MRTKNNHFTALLGAGSEYEGVLRFSGEVRIGGLFKGDIFSDGRLVISKGAEVRGSIKVGELLVSGLVEGEIEVTKLTLLYKDAEVVGRLSTGRLAMEEGALMQGTLVMRENSVADVSLESKRPQPEGIPELATVEIKQ